MTEVPPFLLFFVAALILPFIPRILRKGVLLATPLLVILHIWLHTDIGSLASITFLNFELVYLRVDKLSLIFGYLFSLAGFLAALFALHDDDIKQEIAGLVYVGSTVGAVFAGDLITLFLFWEMLAVSSVVFIWARGTETALKSGVRYLIFQILSGVILLAGALVYYHETGSLAFNHIGLNGIAGYLILLAFGIKCAFPFLHTWLTDAYPESTPTGAVFLSAFTTKLAVYTLARGYAGEDILIYIGLIMMCYPIFFAVIENDLRKTLSYSLINQLGFMVTGIGIGTALAINGAVAHAFSHVIYKSLLFMSMGAVMLRVGHCKASDLGGLYKTMPKTAVMCIIGAASISAFPLFSGFVAKSMVMSALIKEGYSTGWLLALFASAGVLHHAGIKIPFFAFFAHDSGLRPKEAPTNMLIAMAIASFICIFIGVAPQYLYAMLPMEMNYWPYDATHVLAQMQLLIFAALAFVWMMVTHIHPPELPGTNLDAEWFYRKLVPAGAKKMITLMSDTKQAVKSVAIVPVNVLRRSFARTNFAQYHLAESWPTGSMVLWISLILVAYLLLDIFVYV